MNKLVITVTCDTTLTYPHNPHGPRPTDTAGLADEYIRSIEAGASICHLHGTYKNDSVIQPDGRQLQIPIFEGWQAITERIRSKSKAIVQFGLASIRLEQKLELWEKLRPDMSSINFNSHDEYFQPDPRFPPAGYCYSIHPISELREYARLANERNVKLEIESFTTGAFWAIETMRKGEFYNAERQRVDEPNLLPDPLWLTIFLGWPGQSWTPPSAKGLQFMVDHLPANANWSTSCMAPDVYWSVIAHAIAIGGNVRVGMEDCPYIEPGIYAKSNGELVERAVRLAREIGREIASPEEARQLTGLKHG
jgi:3-keto-5-aminohexanoate cleavage enzyme